MRLASIVTTAPRRVSYLDATLSSLHAAGFEPEIRNDCSHEGSYRAFKRAVRQMLDAHPSAEAIAVFQDDILVARGLRDWLDVNLWPADPSTIGVVSLYTATPHHFNRTGWHKLPLKAEDAEPEQPGDRKLCDELRSQIITAGTFNRDQEYTGLMSLKIVRRFEESLLLAGWVGAYFHMQQRVPPHWKWFNAVQLQDAGGNPAWTVTPSQHFAKAYGACAYVMPRASAELLITRCTHPEAKSKTDIHVAETCWRQGLDYWQHTESLVDHRGEVSTMHERPITEFRCAGSFLTEVACSPQSC